MQRPLLLLLGLAASVCGFTQPAGRAQHAQACVTRACVSALAELPEAMRDAPWVGRTMPTPVAESSAFDGNQLMGGVLEWLQTMLLGLELNEEDDELDSLDDDFVATARPWLHTKSFHVCGARTVRASRRRSPSHTRCSRGSRTRSSPTRAC